MPTRIHPQPSTHTHFFTHAPLYLYVHTNRLSFSGGPFGQLAVLGHHFGQPPPGLCRAFPRLAKHRALDQWEHRGVVWRFGLGHHRRPQRPRHLPRGVGLDQSEESGQKQREIPRRQSLWPLAVSTSIYFFSHERTKKLKNDSLVRL